MSVDTLERTEAIKHIPKRKQEASAYMNYRAEQAQHLAASSGGKPRDYWPQLRDRCAVLILSHAKVGRR
jgi:hypothetical protein